MDSKIIFLLFFPDGWKVWMTLKMSKIFIKKKEKKKKKKKRGTLSEEFLFRGGEKIKILKFSNELVIFTLKTFQQKVLGHVYKHLYKTFAWNVDGPRYLVRKGNYIYNNIFLYKLNKWRSHRENIWAFLSPNKLNYIYNKHLYKTFIQDFFFP